MKTANQLSFIGIMASSMALKGINQSFSALVISNTDESHGMGAFCTVKYNALSGISFPYVLQSKNFLRQDVGNYFRHKCTKFHEKSTTG